MPRNYSTTCSLFPAGEVVRGDQYLLFMIWASQTIPAFKPAVLYVMYKNECSASGTILAHLLGILMEFRKK